MRSSSSSCSAPSCLRLAARCGSCSRPGSAGSADRAAGPRRGRSGARRCRSSPSCRCGTAGGARPACVTSSTVVVGVAQRLHPRRAPCGRRRPRGDGTARPSGAIERVFGLPTSCSSAARRSTSVRLASFRPRRIVWREHVLVLVDRVLLELAAPEARGGTASARPGLDEEPQPAAGASRRRAACRARRGSARPTRSRAGRASRCIAAHDAFGRARRRAGDTNRAARSMRSGSSENATLRCQRRVAGACAARSRTPPNGSTNSGSGSRTRHRVDREVAARQVGLDVRSRTCTVGLAVSSA